MNSFCFSSFVYSCFVLFVLISVLFEVFKQNASKCLKIIFLDKKPIFLGPWKMHCNRL